VIGFISEKLLIPILDFFYGLVPSYGLAIVALTVVIRIALFPLSAGSIRSARRMKIAQPVMQKRQAEIKSKFSGDPKKQQEELGKLMNEFGSPLAGCLPLIVQMPVLFALFATYLFKFYFIKIIGGLLLIWIVNDLRKDLFEIKKVKSLKNKNNESSVDGTMSFASLKAITNAIRKFFNLN